MKNILIDNQVALCYIITNSAFHRSTFYGVAPGGLFILKGKH